MAATQSAQPQQQQQSLSGDDVASVIGQFMSFLQSKGGGAAPTTKAADANGQEADSSKGQSEPAAPSSKRPRDESAAEPGATAKESGARPSSKAKKQRSATELADIYIRLNQNIDPERADLVFSKIFEQQAGVDIYSDFAKIRSASSRARDDKGRFSASRETNDSEGAQEGSKDESEQAEDTQQAKTEGAATEPAEDGKSASGAADDATSPDASAAPGEAEAAADDGVRNSNRRIENDILASATGNANPESPAGSSGKLDASMFKTLSLFNSIRKPQTQ